MLSFLIDGRAQARLPAISIKSHKFTALYASDALRIFEGKSTKATTPDEKEFT